MELCIQVPSIMKFQQHWWKKSTVKTISHVYQPRPVMLAFRPVPNASGAKLTKMSVSKFL